MSHDIERLYRHLRNFDFAALLMRESGWSPPVSRRSVPIDSEHRRVEIARVASVPVFEVHAADGKIPDIQKRDFLYRELASLFYKNLLIFLDKERTQSIWYWVTHENGRTYKHEYAYIKGQPEDLFFSKLAAIIADLTISEENGDNKNKTEKMKLSNFFLQAFEDQERQFAEQISGIEDEEERRLYAVILLNRLMFLYFLQERSFLNDGDTTYLEGKLRESKSNDYYRQFLCPLFFEGLSKPLSARSKDIQEQLGNIPYLEGTTFLPHAIERRYPDIQIADSAFEKLFSFFSQYDWQVIDTPGGKENEITPEVFGNIFEMNFNERSRNGNYSTPPGITEYLCRQTIHRLLLDRVNRERIASGRKRFTSMNEMFDELDLTLCGLLLKEILPNLSILDPACGSGAFLVAALNTLTLVYSELIDRVSTFEDDELTQWLQGIYRLHPNRTYALKKMIVTNNLFGVDIEKEAVEIARLSLYLALISPIEHIDELEPLPILDANLRVGNSLIGLLRLSDVEAIQTNLFVASELQTVRMHDGLVAKNVQLRTEVMDSLDKILLAQFDELQRKYGRRVLRGSQQAVPTPSIEDVKHLAPFHWCYNFDQIMNERGGFDIILTNPPWGVFKPDTSFMAYYQGLFYQYAPQYIYQNFNLKTRTQRTPVNLYKLFVEQSYNLLREGGYCGVVVPNGICTDQNTTGLRTLLFTRTEVTGLISFENRRRIFEELHPGFQFTLLTFTKGKSTTTFPAAFSRQAIEELDHFPDPECGVLYLSADFLRRFSPETLSLGNFRSQDDVSISEKMLHFPQLGGNFDDTWNLRAAPGIPLLSISRLELAESGNDGLPLYEGKMIHQFTHVSASPHYWAATERLAQQGQVTFSRVGGVQKLWQASGYHGYHLCFRSIASSTDERTLIATILPPDVLVSDAINFIASPTDADVLLLLAAIFNSFIADFFVRLRVSHRVTAFVISRLPIPHPTRQDKLFFPIVTRAARLTCTSREFRDLWEAVMKNSWSPDASARSFAEREQARAELDGLIAHLYHITEEEFAAVLNTFPLVPEPVKMAARNAYRDVERGLIV